MTAPALRAAITKKLDIRWPGCQCTFSNKGNKRRINMYATDYLEENFLNVMKGITFTAPANLYLGLYLSNPSETGTAGTEVIYPGYARKLVTFSAPAAESGGIGIKNESQIGFATSPANVGTVTHIGVSNSISGGNMLAYGELTEPLEISMGDAPVLLAGEIVFYLTGNLSNAYKTKFLNVFRKTNMTGISTYFALYSGNPEAGGSELSGANYARVPVTFSASTELASGQRQIENSTAAQFSRPSTNWGTWVYSALTDAVSGGSPVWVQARTPNKAIMKGYMPVVAAGNLRVAIN